MIRFRSATARQINACGEAEGGGTIAFGRSGMTTATGAGPGSALPGAPGLPGVDLPNLGVPEVPKREPGDPTRVVPIKLPSAGAPEANKPLGLKAPRVPDAPRLPDAGLPRVPDVPIRVPEAEVPWLPSLPRELPAGP